MPKFQNYEVSFVQKYQDVASFVIKIYNFLKINFTIYLFIKLKKSGNPGYQLGEPIIAGTEKNKVINITSNRLNRYKIFPF